MKLTTGKDAPKKVNAFIEISKGSNVKYELDESSGIIKVDRILHTAMFYPYNYGFIAGTKGEDGDPLDIMVISNSSFNTGTFVVAKPIGLLLMKDEEGIDTKIIAVPTEKVDPDYKSINDISDLNEHTKNMISHFFKYYKSLEPGKWAEVSGWEGASKAYEHILKAMEDSKE
ncbi:MAG: inorganic diphosphatase [Candidatus Micrarchaeaceae archaeon]